MDKVEQKNKDVRLFKTLWPYLRPFQKELLWGPFFKFCEAVLETLLPLFIARMIDFGIAKKDTPFVFRQSLILLGIVLIAVCLAFACQYMASVCSQGFGTGLRLALFRRVSYFSQSELQRFGAASLLNRATSDVNQLQIAIAMTIRLVSRAPFLCLGSLIMAFAIHARLALIMLLALPLAALLLWLVMNATIRVYRLVQEHLDQVTQVIREHLAGVKVIRAFSRENLERRSFAEKNKRLADSTIRAGKLAALMSPASALVFNAATLLILWRGGFLVEAGAISRGDLVALISYMTQLVNAMMVVANLVILYPRALASGKRVAAVLAEAEAESPESPPAAASANATNAPAGDLLSVNKITFTYPGSTAPTLETISFDLKPGESLGVIGATGSGKSTLMALLLNFYAPQEGEIFFRGENVQAWGHKNLRERLAFVPQKAALLSGSVRDNLLLGLTPEAAGKVADDKIWAALRVAQAEDFVREKAAGLDAPVERAGNNFSGGQKQRLCLARALLRPFELLILDDASSALDYLTDFRFRQALGPWLDGRALIMISQRVHVVKECRNILVLDDGKAVGLGSHTELLKSCPVYRDFASSQLETVAEEGEYV